MILKEYIKIKIDSSSTKYYREKGYNVDRFKRKDKKGRMVFPRSGFRMFVMSTDIMPNSSNCVRYKCFYCGKVEMKPMYLVSMALKDSNKLTCKDKKCTAKKTKETNLKIYGCENVFQNEAIKEKSKKTCLERYGVENVMQNYDIKTKSKENNHTNFKNFISSSRAQIYICDLYGYKINYPVESNYLDMANTEDKICVEWDGGGHRLRVKIGKITDEEFDKKEKEREKYLTAIGWKIIRISSKKEKVPMDNILFEILKLSKSLFSKGESIVRFDIDNKNFEVNGRFNDFDYGELRLIKSVDIENDRLRTFKNIGGATSNYNKKQIVKLTITGEFIRSYDSIKDAYTEIGKRINIPKVLSGKRNHAGGFKWMYKEDYEKLKQE